MAYVVEARWIADMAQLKPRKVCFLFNCGDCRKARSTDGVVRAIQIHSVGELHLRGHHRCARLPFDLPLFMEITDNSMNELFPFAHVGLWIFGLRAFAWCAEMLRRKASIVRKWR